MYFGDRVEEVFLMVRGFAIETEEHEVSRNRSLIRMYDRSWDALVLDDRTDIVFVSAIYSQIIPVISLF